MTYATGKHALALCQRCGFRFKRSELVVEQQTTLKVCRECEDQPVRAYHPKKPRINLPWTSPNIPELTPLFDAPEWPEGGLP